MKLPHILMVSSEERAVYINFRWKQASIDLSVHDYSFVVPFVMVQAERGNTDEVSMTLIIDYEL